MKLFCFLAEVPYGGELYISIDYGFPDFPATIPEHPYACGFMS